MLVKVAYISIEMGLMCKRKWVEAIYLNPMVWDKVYICPRPKINVKLNNERPI